MGDAETHATMIMTSVAQLVVQVEVNYLAEIISEYYRAERWDLLEVDEDTYINPRLVITMGAVKEQTAEDAAKASLIPATALPPGMAGLKG